jgi:ATP-dependent protease Clp ATPase subunit
MKMTCKFCGKTKEVLDSNNPNAHYSEYVCGECIDKNNEKIKQEYSDSIAEDKYCPQCGKKLDNGDIYYNMCSNCKFYPFDVNRRAF